MLRLILGFATGLILATPALAGDEGESGMYGEIRGGTVFAVDSETSPGGLDTDLSFDTGWLAEIAAGYAHSSGLRGELALGYRTNDLDEIEIEGFGSADAVGEIWAGTAMANFYYDLHLHRVGLDHVFWSRFRPFVGGGIGGSWIEIDSAGEEDDFTMAYQGLGGFSYAFTSNWEGGITYSYFAALDPEFDGVDIDYAGHNVMGGIRFRFR